MSLRFVVVARAKDGGELDRLEMPAAEIPERFDLGKACLSDLLEAVHRYHVAFPEIKSITIDIVAVLGPTSPA